MPRCVNVALVLVVCVACADGATSDGEGEAAEGGGEGEGEGAEGEGEGAEGEGDGPAPCAPTAGGPWVIEEGALLEAPIACGTGRVLTADDVIVTGLPDGASFDGANMRVVWQTDLDDAQVIESYVTVRDTAEICTVKIAVADALFDPANAPIVDPEAYTEELGLPVIFVSPRPNAEEYVPAQIVIEGRRIAGEIKLRGAFSLSYPKNSYTVKLNVDVDLPWLKDGHGGDRDKLVLTSTFDDNSYVRQRLLFALWDALSRTSDEPHVEVGIANAVVYVDGAYEGVYVVTDHIDRDLYGASLASDEGGNLYKAINHDANFKLSYANGNDKNGDLAAGYVLRDEVTAPVNLWTDLTDLVTFATATDDATLADQLDARISAADLVDWWVLVRATDSADSAGKNSYLYFAPDEQRFRAVPWDFNHSFGQAWQSGRTDPRGELGWYDGGANGLFGRMLASATWSPVMRARMSVALAGPLSQAEVLARFDAYVAEVALAGARDWAVWGDAYRDFYADFANRSDDFTSYEEEAAYARTWIEERWAYLAELE